MRGDCLVENGMLELLKGIRGLMESIWPHLVSHPNFDVQLKDRLVLGGCIQRAVMDGFDPHFQRVFTATGHR